MQPWFFIHIKLFFRYYARFARKDVIVSILFIAFVMYGVYSIVRTRSLLNIALLHGGIFSMLYAMDGHRKDKEFLSAVADNPSRIYLAEYLSISLLAVIMTIAPLTYIANGLYIIALFAWLPICVFLAKRQKARAKYFPISKTVFWTHEALIRSIPKHCFEWRSGMRRHKLPAWIFVGLTIQMFGYSIAEVGLISFGIVTFVIVSFYDICEQSEFIEIFADTPRVFLGRKIFLALVLASISFAPFVLCFMLLHFQKFTLLVFGLLTSYTTIATAIVAKYAYYSEKQRIEIITGITSAVVFVLCLLATVQPILISVIVFVMAYLIKIAHENLTKYFQPA
jgi:hypothetical protein